MNRVEQRLAKAPLERRARRRKRYKRIRKDRDLDSRGCETLKEARAVAKRHGLTLTAKRLAGRAAVDDSLHVQFRFRGFEVAELWGTTGTLMIGGQKQVVSDVLAAIEAVSRTIENAEAARGAPLAGTTGAKPKKKRRRRKRRPEGNALDREFQRLIRGT
jgi:hypothetical protein